ncbi:ankyrin repeat-containing domain protein [Haematococcus lacustris]
MPRPAARARIDFNLSVQGGEDGEGQQLYQPARRTLPDGGGCSCARCLRKQGPVREDSEERVQYITEILAEVEADGAAEAKAEPNHRARARQFMQAVESNDVESLTLHFKETDDKLWTEIVEQLIISAAQLGHCDVIRCLAKHADSNDFLEVAEASKEGTPLMFAAHNGHTAAVRLLLELGADPNAMDLNGYTALMITTFADRGAAAELICKCPDVDVDYPDARNRTAFSYAALYGAEHCAQVLAAAGADVYVRDFEDKDPLELANESGGKPSCVELIKRLQLKARMAAKNELRKQGAAKSSAGKQPTEQELKQMQAEADAKAMQLLQELEAESQAKRAKEEARARKAKEAKKAKGQIP